MPASYTGIDQVLWDEIKVLQYQYKVVTKQRITVIAMLDEVVKRGIAVMKDELAPVEPTVA